MNITEKATGHKALIQDAFRGLYSRGTTELAPDSYFEDCLNNRFYERSVLSRLGTVLNFTKQNIVRFFVYKRLDETPRFLVLDSSGNLYDSLYSPAIYSDATFLDASFSNYNNRAYITPHIRKKGIASKSLLVYDGSGTARIAGGAAPTGFSIGATESVSAGKVEEGYHFYAVAYGTDTGFITAPGPAVWTSLLSSGGFKVSLTTVSAGPTYVSKRYILATKAIPASLLSANQYAYELFFVPSANGGIINDNTTTTATLDFYDLDLLDSADYLIDNLATIPAGVGVCTYNRRFIIWGADGSEHVVRVSDPNSPETFNSVTGLFTVDPSEATSGIRNCFPHRNALIIGKSNRIYTVTDNGDDPSTWVPNEADKSVGTEAFGVATILDARGTNTDRVFIASRGGLINWEGYAKKPELSWNIEDVWNRINKVKFDLVQIIDDPVKHRLLVLVPLDSATAISHGLYADYSEAFTVYGTIDERKFKWSIWTFPTAPTSIVGDSDATTLESVFHIALSAGNIYTMKDSLTADFANVITSYFKTSLKSAVSGWLNHFNGLKLRVVGSGNLNINLYGEDDVTTATATAIAMSASPGLELSRPINFINEKMSVKLGVTAINETYEVSRLDVMAKALWRSRPA